MLERKCGGCEAFKPLDKSPNNAGVCRRHPPQPLVYQYETSSIYRPVGNKGEMQRVDTLRGFIDGFFPATRADLSCMEWVEKWTVAAPETETPAEAEPDTADEVDIGDAPVGDAPVGDAPVAGLALLRTH